MDNVLKGYLGAAKSIVESVNHYPSYDSDKANVLDEIARIAAEARDKIVRRGDANKEGDLA